MDRATTPRGRLRRVHPQPTFGTAAFVLPKGVITGALVIGAAGLLIAIGISVYLVFLRRTRAAKGRRRIPSGSGQADAEVVVEDRRWARSSRARGAGGVLLATLPSADSTLRPGLRGVGDSGLSFFSGLMSRLTSSLRATSRRDADEYDDGWDGASTGRSTGPRFMASTVSGKPLQVVVKTAAVAARHPDSLSLPLASGAAGASSLPLAQQQQQQRPNYAYGGPGGGGHGGGGGQVSGGGGMDPAGQSAERYLHSLWESMHSTGPVVGSSNGAGAKSRGGAGGGAGGAGAGAGPQHGREVSAAGAAAPAPARLELDGDGAGPGPGSTGMPPGLSPLRVGGVPPSRPSGSSPSFSGARAGTAVAAGPGGEAGGGGGTPLARISIGAGGYSDSTSRQPGSAKSGGGGAAANVGISLGGAGDSIPGLSSSYAEAAMVALMAAGGAISNTPHRGGGPGGVGGSVDPAVAWYGKKVAGAQQAAVSTTSVAAALVTSVAAGGSSPGSKAHLA